MRESNFPAGPNGADNISFDNVYLPADREEFGLFARGGAEIRCPPPYSPDLNPIEQMLAKLKALQREIAAHSVAALWTAISQLVGTFDPDEGRNRLRNSSHVRSAQIRSSFA